MNRTMRFGLPVLVALGCLALLLGRGRVSPPDLPMGGPEAAPDRAEPTPGPFATPVAAGPARKAVPALRIQVVDHGGIPVEGIPVGLVRAGADERILWRGITAGAEGLVEAPRHGTERLEAGPALAVLLLPMAWAEPVEVDPVEPPEEPVRLLLPPMGQVRVRVAIEGGGPVPDRVRLLLSARGAASDLAGRFLPMSVDRYLEPGGEELLFSQIGLGLELGLRALFGFDLVDKQGRGPVLAGETVEFALVLPAFPVLVGRLLDPAGEPVRERTFLKFSCDGDGFSASGLYWTDAEGMFRVALLPLTVGARDVRLVLTDRRSSQEEGRRAEAEVPGPLKAGENFLGDLVLREPRGPAGPEPREGVRLLCEGWVRDPQGRPLEGIRLEVEEAVDGPDGPAWRYRGELAVESDAAGAFRIEGKSEARELRLSASSRTYLPPPPLRIPTGSRSLELVLRLGGVVEGSLVLDPGIPPEELHLALLLSEAAGKPSSVPSTLEWSPGARFRFTGLPAGEACLAIRAPYDRHSLLIVEGIVVLPGETTRDPRLQEVDLRGRLRPVDVTVVVPPGRKVDFVQVTTLAGRFPSMATTSIGRPLRFYLGRDPLDLLLEAEGFPPQVIDGVSEDRRIVLVPGEEIVLRLNPAVRLPQGGLSLEATLEREGTTEAEKRFGSMYASNPATFRVCFDRAREARVRVAHPGGYALRVALLLEGQGRRERREVAATPGRLLTGGGEILVHIASEELDRALEEFRKPAR